MTAHVITLQGTAEGRIRLEACLESHERFKNEFKIEPIYATTPEGVESQMAHYGLVWEWPWERERICPISGLKQHPYRTKDPKARMACFLSHFRLWELCAETGPLIVLEDDFVFTRHFDPIEVSETKYGMISLNDPRGATRKASEYHWALQEARKPVRAVPTLDEDHLIPQGLPGHSAYFLKQKMAERLMEQACIVGCWPNDALACRQLFPDRLGCLVRYAGKVSGRPSQLA